MLITNIIVIVVTLVILMVIHELGHFILAKKFGMPVEEFGVGYPPRIVAKKFGNTIYSLNWLPFGAFVKILGEDEENNSPQSFSKQAIWKRALVLTGGVASFWLIAVLMFALLMGVWGAPAPVGDADNITGARVLISMVASDSPAEQAGLLPYDVIEAVRDEKGLEQKIDKAQQMIDFVEQHKGQKIDVVVKRNDSLQAISLVPRVNPGPNEGPMGIGLLRVVTVRVPWYQAPYQGVVQTARQTQTMVTVLAQTLVKVMKGEKVTGMKFVGHVGVGSLMNQAMGQGFNIYLSYVIIITIWMAVFNLLPIPALDGGQLLFLGLEALRGKPIKPKIQQGITAAFFGGLILLMLVVTIKDIIGLILK